MEISRATGHVALGGASPLNFIGLYAYRGVIVPETAAVYDYSTYAQLDTTNSAAAGTAYQSAALVASLFYRGTTNANTGVASKGQVAAALFAYNYNTGTTLLIAGSIIDVRNLGTSGVYGTVTKLVGHYINAMLSSGGTVTTAAGIYLEAQTIGATNWQIYSAGGDVCFNAGTLYVGKTTGLTGSGDVDIAGKLNVDGAVGMGADPVSYAQLYVYRNATAPSNYEYGMFSASTITGAFADQNTYGIQFSHSFYSPTIAVTNAYSRQAAMRANMYNYAVASVTNVDGANYDVRNVGGGNVTAMNGIAVMASRNTAPSGGSAGVITRNVGLYLQQQTVGYTNWQIYSDGGNACFNAGTLYVGKTTGLTGSGDVDIAGKLNVDGTLTTTGGIVGEAWTNITTFSGDWVAYGGTTYAPPGYWKDALGIVHLRGLVKYGTAPITLPSSPFTLPTGYKPQYASVFACVTNEAFGRVDVLANGQVLVRSSSSVYVSLDGISFRAA